MALSIVSAEWVAHGTGTTVSVPSKASDDGNLRIIAFGIDTQTLITALLSGYTKHVERNANGTGTYLFSAWANGGTGFPASSWASGQTVNKGYWDVVVKGLIANSNPVRTTGSYSTSGPYCLRNNGALTGEFCIGFTTFDGADATFTGLEIKANGYTEFGGSGKVPASGGSSGVTGGWGWTETKQDANVLDTLFVGTIPADGFTNVSIAWNVEPVSAHIYAIDGVPLLA